jgi:hypothetical protein
MLFNLLGLTPQYNQFIPFLFHRLKNKHTLPSFGFVYWVMTVGERQWILSGYHQESLEEKE